MQASSSRMHAASSRQASAAVSRPISLRLAPVRSTATPTTRLSAVKAGFAPPPVSETKKQFLKQYSRPIAAIYNVVVQELLVQQHFMRYAVGYQYNEIFALGVVSVFDQVLEQVEDAERTAIFNAYIRSLGEDPEAYRRDAATAERVTEAAAAAGVKLGPEGSDEVNQLLKRVSEQMAGGKGYNRFFAIGLFRMLEINGAKEPSALEALVKAVGVRPDAVNKDLMLYKGILSKLSVAKELMRDFVEREKRKQLERETEKANRAAKEAAEAAGEAAA